MARKKADTAASTSKTAGSLKVNFSYIYLAVFFSLIVIYLAESFIPKPDKLVLKLLHLSTTGYYWTLYPLVIVLVIIWLISLYGALRVKSYSKLIAKSPDGKGMNKISNGLLVLAITMPITSNLSYVLNHIARNHLNLQPTMTIIINYITLGLAGLAFILIAGGSRELYKLIPGRVKQLPNTIWQAVFIFSSTLYAYFIVIQPIHTPLAKKAYYLPDWLLVITIAAPYLFFWYLGTRGAYSIYLYRQNIKGLLYRSALSYVAGGIAVVVLGSVATRVVASISTRLTNLKLTPLLFVIYGLLTLIAIGYVLIAIGARKLRRIEET